MDKGNSKTINTFKLLTSQRSTYSKTILAKIIFSTSCKTPTSKAIKFIRKSYIPTNITIREINIYILTIRTRYNKTLFYKRTSTKR